MPYTLEQLYNNAITTRKRSRKTLPERLLCLDPGETTGWGFFIGLTLQASGQINTSDMKWAGKNIDDLLKSYTPTEIVMEDYRVYASKIQQHTHSKLMTPRIIGILEDRCVQRSIPYRKQMAALAKGFVTDQRLEEFGMWQKGQKHARDAIRHGCYYLLFGKDPSDAEDL